MEQRNRLIRLASGILEDEYLDLYALAAAALVFTILGVTGVASIADLASMILALLTVLAFSQIRSRRQIAGIAITQREARDGPWYGHFPAEAERMWRDGRPWPLDAAQALARAPRPAFLEAFGTELGRSMSGARDLLITGVARNTLLTSSYSDFEQWLQHGCQIRFLLVNPSSDYAVSYAAERYYAERSPVFLRERINHALRILEELQRSTSGSLSVRLTSYPLSLGIIAVDSMPTLRSEASAIFAEYYTYQSLGEPKFVLQPAEGRWYDNVLGEAEALWASATEYPLGVSSR